MSKYIQQTYGASNEEAGHLSSIPYMLASILVPLLGHLLAYYGEANYEKFLALASFLIGFAHVLFLILKQKVESDGILTQQYLLVIPCLVIGCGHALQATVVGPLVNKLVSKKA